MAEIVEEEEAVGRQLVELAESDRFKPEFLKTQSFKEKMELMKQGRRDRDALTATLNELRMKVKHVDLFNVNFFRKLEEESKEQASMKK